ncbi:endonuclease domain-containing protein [Streptomyces sp. NPDC058326]|uniref:endonuclease domain-containing protein n=1 Tax=Streptomyces sp. NPDC058326 TaxID=3346447 RepID=UPI0036E494B3
MYELAILARGGVLLTVWAVTAGWPPGRLAGRLHRDGWQWICRGAWAAPGKEVDWRVRATALQFLRPELVCSHGTAAELHRIERLGGARPSDVLDFTAARPAHSSHGDRIRVHATLFLTARDRTTRRGLRTTTPARTVGDLIRGCGSREEAVVVADSALARRSVGGVRREPLVRYEELAAELSPPRRGAVRARAWLPLTEAASGSPAESVARLRIGDAGLFPESQPALRTADGRLLLRPDFLFRAEGLAVEVEGYAFHGTRSAHERDVARFNALQSCPGVRRVLRFTAGEVFRHPDRMTATIRAALASLSR